MKALAITFAFLATHMLIFVALSAIGSLFNGSFVNVVTNPDWFVIYSLIIGWIPSLAVCHELHESLYKSK